MEQHFTSIRRKAFFCPLRDSEDGATKVLPLTKRCSPTNRLNGDGASAFWKFALRVVILANT